MRCIYVYREAEGNNHDVMRDVGQSICKAFIAYNDQDYATAVDLINPVRYDIITIGGSHAQVRCGGVCVCVCVFVCVSVRCACLLACVCLL